LDFWYLLRFNLRFWITIVTKIKFIWLVVLCLIVKAIIKEIISSFFLRWNFFSFSWVWSTLRILRWRVILFKPMIKSCRVIKFIYVCICFCRLFLRLLGRWKWLNRSWYSNLVLGLFILSQFFFLQSFSYLSILFFLIKTTCSFSYFSYIFLFIVVVLASLIIFLESDFSSNLTIREIFISISIAYYFPACSCCWLPFNNIIKKQRCTHNFLHNF